MTSSHGQRESQGQGGRIVGTSRHSHDQGAARVMSPDKIGRQEKVGKEEEEKKKDNGAAASEG